MNGLRRHWRSLLIALAIPLLGMGVFPAVRSAQETQWLESAQRSFPAVDSRLLALPRLCAEYPHTGRFGEMCVTEARPDRWFRVSAVALAAGLPGGHRNPARTGRRAHRDSL